MVKQLTPTMANASTTRRHTSLDEVTDSGRPNEAPSICTASTIIMLTIRSSSMLDCLPMSGRVVALFIRQR